jgi:hypothetical protein
VVRRAPCRPTRKIAETAWKIGPKVAQNVKKRG